MITRLIRNSTLLRILGISLLGSLALGVASFYLLREWNNSAVGGMRKDMMQFFAENVEAGPYAESVRNPRSRDGRPLAWTNLWVFSRNGALLASNTGLKPPVAWDLLKKPAQPHDFIFHYRPFLIVPDLALMKLAAPDGAYLLIEFRRQAMLRGTSLWTTIAFVLFIVALSLGLAIMTSYVYIRKKARETRSILNRLEKGDLSARFKTKRTDEIGKLMMDFNRMASETERLVRRLQETELARKNLLEELSHDLRTPLTSLRTSVETLSEHFPAMPQEDQKEFLSIVRMELSYFLHLIEDLFFIANIAEPRYKKTVSRVDLDALIWNEVQNRQTRGKRMGKQRVFWNLTRDRAPANHRTVVLGDPVLLQRLIKNAMDNASKHAASLVDVRVESAPDHVTVQVENDGAGITDEAITGFAQRRKHRTFAEMGGDYSLGLGSVIMKTILDLHGGKLQIARRASQSGTQLTLELPKDQAVS